MILYKAPVENHIHLQSLLKSLVDEPFAKFPSGALKESDVRPLSPPPHILPDLQKGENEKYLVTIHEAPRGQKAYIQWGLPQCHAAFSTIPSTLAWVDQSPVIQHVF